ncbi:hypothetical protein [Chryseobacterium limigenitum]|uniref:Uncharacterized protein n=1 Tax=Chryseobacterium limigenitum TaxID=1612149 RepID=A0A1K2IVE2_9FLAO|nr:hypothetical protein [Chryseobacterium limigenitum]SFZ96404.1 hypothetical protein SAMN05216324_11944 [Chryseobacterium limigenitum]
MHKKLFFILLCLPLVVLFINVIHPVISYIKSEVYEKTQYDISKNKFDNSETVCFTEKDLAKAEWKEEKEFVLNGFSYDVIKITVIKGVKYFYCYTDKKDIVINSLVKLSKFFITPKKSIQKQIDLLQPHKNILKTFNSLAIFDQKEFIFLKPFYSIIRINQFKRLENTFYLSITIPPPETRSKLQT